MRPFSTDLPHAAGLSFGRRQPVIPTIAFSVSIVLLLAAAAVTNAETLYVSPAGNDANPGTRGRPLRSMRGARDRVRALKDRTKEDVIVLFAAGEYFVDRTIRFGKEDSARPGTRVIYKNQDAPGSAVLIGGHRITRWRHEGDGLYSTPLQRDVFALFENGQPATLAREPNKNYHFAESVLDFRRLKFGQGDYQPFDYHSAAVCLWAHWIPARTRIKSVDFRRRIITLVRPYAGDLKGTVWDDHWAAKTPTRYYIYNSKAFLDRPAEFCVDTKSHTLYYRPRRTPIEKQTILAPDVSRLISLDGASRITFQGLNFQVCDGLLEVIPALSLHSKIRGGLIHLKDAKDVTIKNCQFSNSGQNGIIVEGGVVRCTIEGNVITRVASGGIRFVEGGNRGGRIENNWIHHIGEGIYIYGCDGYKIQHNLIHDVDSNGFKALRTQNTRVAYNDISRVGLDGTDSDAAGIYVNVTAGGPNGGHIVIDHNLIHDLVHNGYPGYPSAAIYLDMDGVYNCTVSNNIVYNVKHKFGIHVRGAHHVIRNNIIDFSGPDLLAAFTLLVGYKPANV
ncbi:MAG: right-handed parallel beta-helix repeat-containing protein, partial [Planctomycetes bacterium]|nr:right-handed parallel beta-helix repeat-containing protein [Planctomycetota bacterium]